MRLRYYTGDAIELSPTEQALYGKSDIVRQMVRASIRRYVNDHRELLSGRVLDYGCGRLGTCAIPQPYRSLINAKEYVGWEPGDSQRCFHQAAFDGILCTQVLQNVDHPYAVVQSFSDCLKRGGHAVITYPIAWQQIEDERWRFTQKGMWLLVHEAGLAVVDDRALCSVELDGALTLELVGGMVVRKNG